MKRVLFFCVCFFLWTIQRREISLIFSRASPLAAKFCTKTKRTTFIRPLECAILLRIRIRIRIRRRKTVRLS